MCFFSLLYLLQRPKSVTQPGLHPRAAQYEIQAQIIICGSVRDASLSLPSTTLQGGGRGGVETTRKQPPALLV